MYSDPTDSAASSITDKEIQYVNDAIKNGWAEKCYNYLNDFTSEVIGPIYLNKKDGKIVSNFINHNKKNILNLPCFSLLSKFLINNQTNEICILENDCFEIDTVEDLNYASRKLSFND